MADGQPEGKSRRRFLGGLAATAAFGSAGIGTKDALAQAQGQGIRGRLRSASLQSTRLAEALRIRTEAAAMASSIDPPDHIANGDERADIDYALSFTKGLAHDYETGLVRRTRDFERFVDAIETGDRDDIRSVPHGPHDGFQTADDDAEVRGWETPAAGHCFNLVGHDPQSLAMPPAPRAGSAELIGEMAEVYAQAALRDMPFTALREDASANSTRDQMLGALTALPWFDADARLGASGTDTAAAARRRTGLSLQTAFRGLSRGETVGPYLSQLLLIGSSGPNRAAYEGIIDYGAQTIDQRVRRLAPTDFMTSWDEWLDVNTALSPSTGEPDTGGRRFITTGRDLATYVHTDALYQAYFNACLVLVSNGIELDPSLPYRQNDAQDHQQGFVLYSLQQMLSMLGEVSDRALRTVFFQKFNVHRRLRPEALAARIEKADLLDIAEITTMSNQLNSSAIGDQIRQMTRNASGTESMLLPMAFAEGSPMHPSYGAGHATVAGACVTLLKTFFDHTRPFDIAGDASTAFVPTLDGSRLATVNVYDEAGARADLTVEGELNKLAANIAIGRNWAGVHYFTDYWESLLLGEQVAIQFLREHLLTLPEQPQLRVPRFDGSRLWL